MAKVRELGYAPRDLFIIFSIKFAESTAYYAFSYVYTAFLSEEFDMSDVEAGVLYTLYGLLCSAIGLLVGPLIDAIDLRTALLLGTIPSFIGRLGSALTESSQVVSMCSYFLLPLGAAFGMPVFALGVRRFTHPQNRAFAFTVFYAVLCVASMCGGLLITWVRANFHDGLWLPLVGELSWMRVNVLLCACFTLYTCAASCFVRPLRVRQDAPLDAAENLEPCPRATHGLRATLSTVCGSKPFWKLLGLSLIVAMGTRATFRHLDATFPKYFMRMHGDDAPFELFVAVEPVATVLLSFPVTFLLLRRRVSTFTALVGGTLLQSFCPLALMVTSYQSALAFVMLMALGEAVWSPRLYEYSTMVAPEGFEGTFVAVTFVPQYVSAGVVGVSSGYLLERYVPEELEPGEQRHPEMLWGLVAAASFSSPLLLTLFRSLLFGEEPTLQHEAPPVATRKPVRSPQREKLKREASTLYAMAPLVTAEEDGDEEEIEEL